MSGSRTASDFLSMYLVGVSLIGLLLLSLLVFVPSHSSASYSWQKTVVGTVFSLICVMGMIAGVFPSRCSSIFQSPEKSQTASSSDSERKRESVVTFEGHHPNCENFRAHVFEFLGRKYCAGCTGLVTGAAISLLGTSSYFFFHLSVGENVTFIFFLGSTAVALGLLKYSLFDVRSNAIQLFLNAVFVLGAFLLLIGIDKMTGSLAVEAYFLMLTLLWILTRILMSQKEHRRICSTCGMRRPCYLNDRDPVTVLSDESRI